MLFSIFCYLKFTTNPPAHKASADKERGWWKLVVWQTFKECFRRSGDYNKL